MLLVVYTCVSRNLNPQKKNQLNPTTPPRENVLNVHEYWDILMLTKNSKIGPHIVHFLLAGWSDCADSFCNESGFLRHKFSNILFQELWNSTFFRVDPFCGTPENLCWSKKKVSRYSHIYIGHHIRYLRIWYEDIELPVQSLHILDIFHLREFSIL